MDYIQPIVKEFEKIINNNSEKNFVIDGVIDSEKYANANCKILWILKETNSDDETWSYQDKFKDKEWLLRCGRSIPTLRRIIYTTYGILRNCDWSDIPYADKEKSWEPLQEIALINVKKDQGGSSSNNEEIQQAYYDYKSLLKKQIETYDADVIIFGNTMNFFDKEDFEGLSDAKKEVSKYGNHYYNTGEKLYIHTWHPAARGKGFTDKEYVSDLINIVKDWKTEAL